MAAVPRGRLAGKNAVISGAAGGIGLETTILFLHEGASVLMTDISEAALERGLVKVKEHAPNATGKLATLKCDVTKEADVKNAIEYVDAWGGVDVVFNNAGIMHADDAGELACCERCCRLLTRMAQMP